MKKTNFIYSLFIFVLCLTSCTGNMEIYRPSVPVESATIKVKTEQTPSRSVIDIHGKHYWCTDDTISVFGNDSFNAIYTLKEQDVDEATFIGNLNSAGENIQWAYYPYNQSIEYDGNSVWFELAELRQITQKSEAPMLGLPESDNQMYFKHLGGILYLRLTGIPQNASHVKIVSLDEESPFLSGKAVIEDIKDVHPIYKIVEGNKHVIYELKQKIDEKMFYHLQIPLGVGNYKKISVELIDNNGATIKKNTVSDIEISRSQMIEMDIINYSENIYAYNINPDYLTDTNYSQYILFNNDIHWVYNENSHEFSIIDMQPSKSNERVIINGTLDESGRVCYYNMNGINVFMSNFTDTSVDMMVAYNDTIETYPEIPVEAKSRGVIEADLFLIEEVLNDVLLLSTIFKKYDTSKLEDWLDASMNYNDIVSDYTEIVGSAAAMKLLYDAELLTASPLFAIAGDKALVSAFIAINIDILKTILESSADVAKVYLYKRWAGSASVTNIEPKQIDEYSFEAGYKLVKSSSIPEQSHIQIYHGLLVQDWPNGQIFRDNYLTYNNIHAEKLIESTDISSDQAFSKQRVFVKGYTYYTRAFIGIIFNGIKLPLFYFSDVEKITFDDAKINAISVSQGNFVNGAYNFKLKVYATCQDASSAYTMCLTKNDEIIETRTWGKKDNSVSFDVSLFLNDMNMETLSAKDKWSIKILSNNDYTDEYIDEKDFDLAYKVPKSLSILSWKVTDTRENNSSRALNDNNDEKTYESDVEVTVAYNGGGWFNDICIATSDGHSWSTTETINCDNSTVKVKGTLIYSESKSPASLSCYGILKDSETQYNGYGIITFPVIPIPVTQ